MNFFYKSISELVGSDVWRKVQNALLEAFGENVDPVGIAVNG